MKMRFQDRVSQAIWELERARNPPLRAQDVNLDAFTPEKINLPPNTGPAIEILQSLKTVEAYDYIGPMAGGSHEAKNAVSEKLVRALAKMLLRDGLVDIEIGDLDHKGYPVRARVRVMKPGPSDA